METKEIPSRYTTQEAARRLHCVGIEAIRFLRAANVNYSKCGGSYLWDATGVEHVVATLTALNPEYPKKPGAIGKAGEQ